MELLRRFISQERVAKAEFKKEIYSPLSSSKKMISLTGPLAAAIRDLLARYGVPEDLSEYKPPEVYEGFCKTNMMQKIPTREKFVPLPHQTRIAEWFERHRAVLLDHSLGSGKTCTYAMIMARFIEFNPRGYVFFISPGGLRRNFMEEFCTFCPCDRRGITHDYLESRVRFLSLDDSTLIKKLPERFENCLVVIDEAHHLNSSQDVDEDKNEYAETERKPKGMKQLYKLLVESGTGFKLVLGSGTPMEKKLSDHYCMLSLLKPGIIDSYDAFVNLFMDLRGNYVPRDRDVVRELYKDCISRFKTPAELLPKVTISEVKFEQLGDWGKLISRQYNNENIILAEGLERLTFKYMGQGLPRPAARAKAKIDIFRASTHDISSRMSMMIYPILPEGMEENEDNLLAQFGYEWVMNNSAKMNMLVNNVYENPGKHAIYTPFKTKHGAYLVSKILDVYGISNVIYSGDLSSDSARNEIMINFNSKENALGDKIKVIILTNAGNEGLTILDVQWMHILHQYVYESKIQQVIGRCIRIRSHDNLPMDKRQVHVLRYFSGIADEECYKKGLERMRALQVLNKMVEDDFCIEKQ
jgi:superfamily II DNA or RNA helicase